MKRSSIGIVCLGFTALAIAALHFSARASEGRENSLKPAPVSVPGQATPAFTFVVAPDGNSARYRVREQLAGLDLPNDAVGETKEVSGSIGLDKSGSVIPESSRIVVGIDSLKSDKDRRDGYLRRRVLEAEKFPSVDFVITAIRGVKLPVPKSGTRSFTIEGNLTIRGVTRPTTWSATAAFADSVITGKASTKFTFSDFTLTQPRVPVVLSVADTIGLEYDFKLLRKTAK